MAIFTAGTPIQSLSVITLSPTNIYPFLLVCLFCSLVSSVILLQDPGLKYLHYVDSAAKFQVRHGLEDLPDRIEIAQISEIATGTGAPPPNVLRDQQDSPMQLVPSPLSFSLMSAHEESLADQIAPDQSRWADWTDGLNMLRRDGGHATSEETAGFVNALTEIGLKIKLLSESSDNIFYFVPRVFFWRARADKIYPFILPIKDLSGEMVEIPSGLVAGPPPSNTDFYFSDL
jgi:engulfment/cell motility protein 1